jgi:hypothetical protein
MTLSQQQLVDFDVSVNRIRSVQELISGTGLKLGHEAA